MNDTSEKVAALVAARHAVMSADERVRAAAAMYEVARAIVDASIPEDVRGEERRYRVLKRFYADDMPDAALRARIQPTLDSVAFAAQAQAAGLRPLRIAGAAALARGSTALDEVLAVLPQAS